MDNQAGSDKRDGSNNHPSVFASAASLGLAKLTTNATSSNSRRGVGLSAFDAGAAAAERFLQVGTRIRESHEAALVNQLEDFRERLAKFANIHGQQIRADPTFRAEFARMCSAVGFDILGSSMFANAPGSGLQGHDSVQSSKKRRCGQNIGEFYWQLAIKLIEVCRETRDENGGLISVEEVLRRIKKGRARGSGAGAGSIGGWFDSVDVTEDDVVRAVESLSPLEGGISVMEVGDSRLIMSIPKELRQDQTTALAALHHLESHASPRDLHANLSWNLDRARTVLIDLAVDGFVWVDRQTDDGRQPRVRNVSVLHDHDGIDQHDDDNQFWAANSIGSGAASAFQTRPGHLQA